MMNWIIDQAQVFNSYKKCFNKKSVYIENGYFKQIADNIDLLDFHDAQIIDANGLWMIPGLVDIHMHIESSMTTPTRFSSQGLKFGTTTVVADPHEIANVFGKRGIDAFMDTNTVMDIFYGIPSSVPSTSCEYETTGGVIGESEVLELLKDSRVICLGEVMNFKDLVSDEDTLIKRIVSLCKQQRPSMPLEGHCPKITGSDLAKFIATGVNADHTMQSPESIMEKIENGMFLEVQGKCLTQENVSTLINNKYDESYCLCTDDTMPDHFLEGQLNKVLLKAVSLGMSFEQAIYASTYTPSMRMQLFDRGVIAPGKIADFCLLSSLKDWMIESVYKNGEEVYTPFYQREEDMLSFPDDFYKSIKLDSVDESIFQLRINKDVDTVKVNVIEVNSASTFTDLSQVELPVMDHVIQWQNNNLALMACLERYGKNQNVSFAFVKEAIKNNGAVASSWAHDHHNVMVMGTNVKDMITAVNHIINIQGGYCVSCQGDIIACAPLPIGGIVSNAPLDELGNDILAVRKAMSENLGYTHNNAIMSFATLSLPVSPMIKLTDKGMIIGKTLEVVPLIIED